MDRAGPSSQAVAWQESSQCGDRLLQLPNGEPYRYDLRIKYEWKSLFIRNLLSNDFLKL